MKTKVSQFFATIPTRLQGLILGIWLSALPIAALAAAGDLDTTFDGDGKVSTVIGTFASAYGVAIQSDGKIVAVGETDNGPEEDFAVARYNSNGSLDSGFGVGGVATTSFNTCGDSAYGVVIQSDGKIVVAGNECSTNFPDFAVARYNSNGSLDTSFSTDGKTTTAFGSNDYGRAVALQTDGKIVVAGYTDFSGNNDFAVVRFNSDGSKDTSFDTDGEVTTSFGGDDQARAVLVQPDGKIVAAGFWDGGSAHFAVARYNSNGSLDTSFSTNGLATVDFGAEDFARAAALQADGKIVLAGCTNVSGNSNVALARLNTNGSLDTSFDTDGRVTTAVSASLSDCANGVAIQSDGKIVVTGSVTTGFLAANVVVIRYNSNGSLDTGFGAGGIVTTSVSGLDLGTAVAIQSDGKIVVTTAGFAGFTVLRYEGVTTVPPTTLAVPTAANAFACAAAPAAPVVSAIPATAKPLAITNPTPSDVRVVLQTTGFAGPVDVYVAAALPDGSVFMRTPAGWLPYPANVVPLKALNTSAIDMTSAADNLYAGPLAGLPPGSYTTYVVVLPAFTNPATFSFAASPHYSWCNTKTFP